MHTVLVARLAMATRFEIALHGDDPVALRSAGEEALDEIERIESKLSLYQPTSEIADLNAHASQKAVRVSPEVFALIERASQLTRATEGAFDITVGPLMRCWGLTGETGRVPDAQELAEARQCVGMHLLHMDLDATSVRFERDGVMLDLGAIGKGYAIERAAELLRENGVTSAFIHGGTSTAYGLGVQPTGEPWKVAVDWPQVPLSTDATSEKITTNRPTRGATGSTARAASSDHKSQNCLAIIPLVDEALSVSAPSGKTFRIGEQTYGHVIDPRSGNPVAGAAIAAVASPSAAETDALSTALLTLGIAGQATVAAPYPSIRTLLGEFTNAAGNLRIHAHGIEIVQSPRLSLVE
jgi:FAD:protein FMN transferase